MIEEGLDEQWSRRVRVDDQWEQRLLFLAKVRHRNRVEEAEERRDRGRGVFVGGGRTAQAPRFDERAVVVMRERDQ